MSSLCSGCFIAGLFADAPTKTAMDEKLPEDISSLLAIADGALKSSYSSQKLSRAVAALEKALQLLGKQPTDISPADIHEKLAITCFWAGEIEAKAALRLIWFLKGEDAAEAAIRERPNRVVGYYYLGVLKGRRIELRADEILL